MPFKKPGFIYSACRPLTKNKKEYKNLKKQEILDIYIYIFKYIYIYISKQTR